MKLINLKYFFLLILISPFMACSSSFKTYKVIKVDKDIQLTGKGTDIAWQKAKELTDFTYPWRTEKAPKTSFKALYNDTYFYFLYRATDPEIITKKRGLGERDAVESDRVEIFFKADDKMNPYYALEMDALGRVLDTKGQFYRKVDFDWDWPKGQLLLKASTDQEGYWVEGSISFESLRQLGMYKDDNILKAGLYRGEYVTLSDGEIITKWISWVKPDSETPDFHIPSSFGILKIAK
ncbi:MAG: carbohydrate-binding family 9-like protein [Saprospiraceae bacterium]